MTTQERQYNIIVYGIEKCGLSKPSQEISNRNFRLFFELFNTEKRFNKFDGVILFQGIFETYKYGDGYSGKYLNHSYDRDELDKRKKELGLLLKNGGFVCFILHKKFVDSFYGSGHTQDLHHTDLCKDVLNLPSFHRKDVSRRTTEIHSVRDEFTRFLELHGAANSYFNNYNNDVELREIAKIGQYVVGMVLFDKMYFIPSLLPENRDDCIVEYFSLLAEALTSSFNKLRIEIPLWVSQFYFERENTINDKKRTLLEEIEGIDNELSKYCRYKKALLGSGEVLVESVATILRDGFSLRIDYADEYREDLKIINDDSDPLVFIEIKGTNKSVKREYINQTDSHRERAGLSSTFPSLLMINTHIKNSKNIKDKDQEIP